MQIEVQLDANAVLYPAIENRRTVGPRARRKEKSLVSAEDRIPDMSNPMNIS
jgi:hypothetical protein